MEEIKREFFNLVPPYGVHTDDWRSIIGDAIELLFRSPNDYIVVSKIGLSFLKYNSTFESEPIDRTSPDLYKVGKLHGIPVICSTSLEDPYEVLLCRGKACNYFSYYKEEKDRKSNEELNKDIHEEIFKVLKLKYYAYPDVEASWKLYDERKANE